MRSRELKRMLAEVSKLTPGQRQELMQALSGADEVVQVVQTVQSRPLACPHCQGERVVRNGHASGLQRYKCRSCTRTFNSLTETPLARLRHKGKWERQAEVLRQGLSVHQAADTLSVAPSTAFRWRHRFLQLAQGVKARVLQGVVEADETYFLRSSKGRHFEALTQDEQHRARKRLKRLRYLAEFVAPRYKRVAMKRYLAALEPAQDALGAHNDAVVALERYRALATTDRDALFAVGWLTAKLEQTAIDGRHALKALDDAQRFWR